MPILDRLRGGTVAAMTETADAPDQVTVLSEQLRAEQDTNLLLVESILDIEEENRGWLRVDARNQLTTVSRQGLIEIAAAAQLLWIANPLIRRAVNVRTHYTWGQGVQVAARDERVNAVVQAFLDDPSNQKALFGQEARESKDRALQLDGNLVLALFTSPITGSVQVRTVPFGEITQTVCNPDDRQERWFYLREWQDVTLDPATLQPRHTMQRAFHPDVDFRPPARLKAIAGVEVRWDAPLMPLKVGGLDDAEWGLSEVYPAMAWARAYKGFLEDWAGLAKALSKFAWKGKTKTGRVAALRSKLDEAGRDAHPSLPQRPAGQALVSDDQTDLTPINKTGATLDADSGRPLAMMVAAAMDLPYTILMGDPDVGNLATAKTLDRPTELAMQGRREWWASVLRRLCGYAIDQAVKAPRGPLSGRVVRDEWGREVITLTGPDGEGDRNVDIEWPSILEHDVVELVKAIVEADGTQRIPPAIVCRLLLTALGVEDVDDVMAELVDDNGNFLDPGLAAAATAGAQAARDFDRGQPPVDGDQDKDEP